MGKRKSAAAAALAAAAAAGMVTNSVIDKPADLLTDTPFAVEEAEDTEDAAEQKQKGPAVRLREWILSWHPAVRMLVALPLWCIGWVVLTGISTFWAGAATPLAARLLGWLCLAVILLVVYALSVKAAFPKVSFRRLLRPRVLVMLLGLTALLAAADLALPSVWKGYDLISQIVWRAGATCLLAFACGMELKRQGKKVQHQAAASVQRTAVEREALRLADTVCPPRD